MPDTKHKNGFTLVELVIALTISAIVLTAVATFAYAMSTADTDSDDISRRQAQIRFATLKVSDLIKHCRLICEVSSYDMALWKADNNGDGQINARELVYIEWEANSGSIRLTEFSPPLADGGMTISLDMITNGSAKNFLYSYYPAVHTVLLSDCQKVSFLIDYYPPWTRLAVVDFVLNDSNQYQITAGVSGWAGHLLNYWGTALVGDDDESG